MSAAQQSPFALALAALARGQPALAVPLLEQAQAQGDGGALAGLNLGLALTDLGQFAAAEVPLRRALLALPEQPEPGLRLGLIAASRGETAAARDYLQAVLRRHPAHVPTLAALATLEEGLGQLEAAALLVQRAQAADPAEVELALMAGRLALAQGRVETALAQARAVLGQRPAHLGAARLFARALLASLAPDEALREIATRIRQAPVCPSWALAMACAAAQLGQVERAVAEMQAAAALEPDDADIQAELGRLLARQDRPEEALALLSAAMAARPTDLELRNTVATLLWKRHRFAEMAAMLGEALRQFGPHPTLNMNLALVLNAQGQQPAALRAADAAVAQSGGGIGPLINRIAVLPYHPAQGSAADLASAGAAIAALLPAAPPRPARPKPVLRVGLLSGGFGVHPVGWLTLAGLEALPEARFEIAAYSLKPRQDRLNARFRARATLWREVGEQDDERIAAQIAADGVDILIDMGGYGEGGRPLCLRHRPAPVQMKWVGSQFATTGLPFIDHMLTDRWETPPGFEPHYAENLLRLPDGYACYLPPEDAPEVAPLPASRNGHLTFGCFNNLAKLTDTVLESWATLLRRLPTARLLIRTHALSDPGTLRLTEARLAAAGLPRDRLELLGGCPHAAMLASYGRIDLALDPFPYTGGLTVCEALWMGVPVISLAGDSFAGRHALSHLSNVGLADWVATTPAEYVARACRAAADLPALQALRGALRARVRASPLCDAPRFGANLGAALNAAWAAACARDAA